MLFADLCVYLSARKFYRLGQLVGLSCMLMFGLIVRDEVSVHRPQVLKRGEPKRNGTEVTPGWFSHILKCENDSL